MPQLRFGDLPRVEYDSEFEQFWSVYPNRTGKGEAHRLWRKVRPPIDAVLAALDWQCQQPQWLKDEGDFVPLPATWINQQRWMDEPRTPMPYLNSTSIRILASASRRDKVNF